MADGAGAGTVASNLCQLQLAGLGVIIKNLGIAPPLNGGFQLAAGFLFTEMLVKQVAEKLLAKRAVGFGPKGLFHLAEQRHVVECGLPKDGFASLNVRPGKSAARVRNDGLSLFDAKQPEQCGGLDRGEKGLEVQAKVLGKAVKFNAPAAVRQNFQQGSHTARASMRKRYDL